MVRSPPVGQKSCARPRSFERRHSPIESQPSFHLETSINDLAVLVSLINGILIGHYQKRSLI
jgi:hypothetical protein